MKSYNIESVELDMIEAHWDAIVALMDDEVREALHDEIAPCSREEFLEAYEAAHLKKYGERFIFN